ncbi:hypothetical protein [Photobacterium lutimaris]|uniref:Uncharacterized protein n=1 Tax=Photobacterium lutimaris TaxID=388278 RepID=A0A2T3IUG7_9GAMM|nr:hypothetical protein [Photobacterium lutimaris]PSU32014.1 hypothetical protein C9I99_19565 [Photobacterium lutimaris]TDR73665.1 hypothetical protein DFP78_11036 [Photobacterium lutimaris]
MKLVYPFLIGMVWAMPLHAGITDPDCTAEKAAKSTASKMTVGVSGRCTPKEAAKDTATGAVNNALPDEGVAGKAVDAAMPGSSTDKKDVKANSQ